MNQKISEVGVPFVGYQGWFGKDGSHVSCVLEDVPVIKEDGADRAGGRVMA